MPKLEAAQLTTPEHIAEIADGLGKLVARSFYPVRFDYAFSSCEYPVVVAQTTRENPYAHSVPVVLPDIETPGTPLLNVLIEKASRTRDLTRPFLARQVSFYREDAGIIAAYEADVSKVTARPKSVDTSYRIRQELHSRKAGGEIVTKISSITVPTVRMIDRLLARRTASDGVELTPDMLQSYRYYRRFISS